MISVARPRASLRSCCTVSSSVASLVRTRDWTQIEVMDYDTIGKDDLIGKTVIDLEDRWFDTRWQVRVPESQVAVVSRDWGGRSTDGQFAAFSMQTNDTTGFVISKGLGDDEPQRRSGEHALGDEATGDSGADHSHQVNVMTKSDIPCSIEL